MAHTHRTAWITTGATHAPGAGADVAETSPARWRDELHRHAEVEPWRRVDGAERAGREHDDEADECITCRSADGSKPFVLADTFCVRVVWQSQSEATARALGITLERPKLNPVMSADQWDAAFAALKKDGVGAVTVMEGPIYGLQAPQSAARRAET